jgi:mannose-P-dolichol utilization defect protein 1
MNTTVIHALVNLSPTCNAQIFEQHIFTYECMTLLTSKILGLLLILMATTYKIPQIRSILRSKSAQGLSVYSLLLDILVTTVSLSYAYRLNHPWTTFGELYAVNVQSMLIHD